MRSHGTLGWTGGVQQSDLRRKRLCRRLRTWSKAVQRLDSANVRIERPVAERRRVRERLQRWVVLGQLQSRSHAVQWPDAADLRQRRNLAERDALLESSLRERRVHRCLRACGHAVLGQRRANL